MPDVDERPWFEEVLYRNRERLRTVADLHPALAPPLSLPRVPDEAVPVPAARNPAADAEAALRAVVRRLEADRVDDAVLELDVDARAVQAVAELRLRSEFGLDAGLRLAEADVADPVPWDEQRRVLPPMRSAADRERDDYEPGKSPPG